MTDLPQPLTPPNCDLKDFAFMPLDVNRLRDSDLASISNGNEFRSAVLLWCASWHQVPSASLPDDDVVLAKLAGYGFVVREWKKVKKGALHGWIKCSDGRLYHPVVAEKAREAWDSKHQHAYDKLADRIRKKNKERHQKNLSPLEIPTFEEWKAAGMPLENDLFPPEVKKPSAGIPPENALKGQGQGQGQGQGNDFKTLKSSHASTVVGGLTLDDDDDPGKGQDPGDGQAPHGRSVQVSILLRGLGVRPMTAMHPQAMEWAENPKCTDELLSSAVDQARLYKPAPEPIHPNYLRPIVAELLNPPPPKEDSSWRKTNEGIDAKGRELGLQPKPRETYHEFAQRIQDFINDRRRKPVASEGAPA